MRAKADAAGLTLRHEPFSPRRLAAAVGEALVARAGNKGVKADIAIADDLPAMVAGDALRLRAALENLADNAVKFTGMRAASPSPPAPEPAARRRVRLVFAVVRQRHRHRASATSTESVPPVRAGERREIARRYGGAGLGLVFVKRIAEAMGGDLTVTSKPGRGSTFRFTVLVDAPTPAARRRAAPARASPARPLSILCAEDNPYGRVVMNTILDRTRPPRRFRRDRRGGGRMPSSAAATTRC